MPDLEVGNEFVSLVEGADTQTDLCWILKCDREHGRAAFRAEDLRAFRATVCSLHVALWFTMKNKRLDRCGYHNSKCRTCELLAVGAMADHDLVFINSRSEANRTAMA